MDLDRLCRVVSWSAWEYGWSAGRCFECGSGKDLGCRNSNSDYGKFSLGNECPLFFKNHLKLQDFPGGLRRAFTYHSVGKRLHFLAFVCAFHSVAIYDQNDLRVKNPRRLDVYLHTSIEDLAEGYYTKLPVLRSAVGQFVDRRAMTDPGSGSLSPIL